MGKRIQTSIAIDAYRVIVEEHQRDSSRKLAGCTQRELVRMLGEAKYTRYDESTAMRLLKLVKKLNEQYSGKVSSIRHASTDSAEFQARLQEFEGIGPKTVEIFMRDAQQILF
jgi:endonuclease III